MTEQAIRVGLVGLGFIGKIHAHAYHAIPYCFNKPPARAELAAVLRSRTGNQAELLLSLGNPLEFSNPEEFYAQTLDMVDICTPNSLHLEQARAAFRRKLNVYCEKPLALNLDQARRMAAEAEKAAVLTHTAFTMRYHPAVQQARAILASGAMGEIYNFRAYLFHNSYMDEQRPISWRLRKESSGGGALADLGVHLMDMVHYLLGEAQWVQGFTRTFIQARPSSSGKQEMEPVDVDDWGLCVLGLQNGACGSIEASRMSGGVADTNRLQIFGSRGSLEIDFNHGQHVMYYDLRRKQTILGVQDFALAAGDRPLADIHPPHKLSMGAFIDAHFACIMDFLLCIRENRESPLNFKTTLKSQEILEATYLSAARGGEKIILPIP